MRLVALEYHDVIAGDDFDCSGFPGRAAGSYKLDADLFAAHLAAVAASGVQVANDVRVIDASASPVLITFDDGGASALNPSAGMLEAHGWRGHFFVTSGQLGAKTFLSRGEARELSARGHVVGSHSHSHPIRFAKLTPGEQREEWRRSRAELEDAIGAPVEVASVPGGYFSRQVAEIAAECGIRWLFTSEPIRTVHAVGTCRVFGRFTPRRNSPASLVAALCGASDRARAGQWLSWNARKLAKWLAGDTYLRLRASVLGEGRGA